MRLCSSANNDHSGFDGAAGDSGLSMEEACFPALDITLFIAMLPVC